MKKLLPFVAVIGVCRLSKAVCVSVYDYLKAYKTKQNVDKEKQILLEQQERERKEREIEEEKEMNRLKEEEEKARIKAEKKLRKLEQSLKATRIQNEEREMENKRILETRTAMETRLKEIELEYEEEDNIASKGGNKKRKKGKKIIDLSEVAIVTATNGSHGDDDNNGNQPDDDYTIDVPCQDDSGWSQYQQKQLEWALSHYTKNMDDRWDKVALAVPGKSKVFYTIHNEPSL